MTVYHCVKSGVGDVKPAEDSSLSRGRTSSAGSFDRMSDTQCRSSLAVMLLQWRVRGKTIRCVLCNILCNNCAHCDAHTYEQTNSSLDWVLSHWAHFTVLRSIFVWCITVCCMHAQVCNTVRWAWWDWSLSLGPLLPSVLWHCWLGHLTRKNRPRYDL